MATLLIALLVAQFFLVSSWYIDSEKHKPLNYGVTFTSQQATSFGLNPEETLDALINDMGVKNFRLTSYWSSIEANRGSYNFTELDSQISKIVQAGGSITLAIGLRQPRWPECHIPGWAQDMKFSEYTPDLFRFIAAAVDRYKSVPQITSWQLENEFYLNAFGNCPDHDRNRLIAEFQLVKSLSDKPIIISVANLWAGIPIGKPRPDTFGISVYDVFYEPSLNTHINYPYGPRLYAWRAGWTKILTGKSSMLHELQAEPWGKEAIWEQSQQTQAQSMDPERIKKQLSKAQSAGFGDIYLWGAEWWYDQKVNHNQPEIWNIVKSQITETSQQ